MRRMPWVAHVGTGTPPDLFLIVTLLSFEPAESIAAATTRRGLPVFRYWKAMTRRTEEEATAATARPRPPAQNVYATPFCGGIPSFAQGKTAQLFTYE